VGAWGRVKDKAVATLSSRDTRSRVGNSAVATLPPRDTRSRVGNSAVATLPPRDTRSRVENSAVATLPPRDTRSRVGNSSRGPHSARQDRVHPDSAERTDGPLDEPHPSPGCRAAARRHRPPVVGVSRGVSSLPPRPARHGAVTRRRKPPALAAASWGSPSPTDGWLVNTKALNGCFEIADRFFPRRLRRRPPPQRRTGPVRHLDCRAERRNISRPDADAAASERPAKERIGPAEAAAFQSQPRPWASTSEYRGGEDSHPGPGRGRYGFTVCSNFDRRMLRPVWVAEWAD